MTEVIQSSPPPSHFPSPSSSSSSSSTPCVLHTHQLLLSPTTTTPTSISSNHHHQQKQLDIEETQEQEEEFFGGQDLDDQDTGGTFLIDRRKERETRGVGGDQNQFSVVALLLAAFRRSIVGCSITTTCTSSTFGVGVGVGCGGGGNNNNNNNNNNKGICKMEIGLPTNVRHVAHVTFDRFNGFLGLPVEFEPEVPRRAPSASATVFGVSTDSMQLSFDSRGNSVPTILLMMQRHLYARGGLQAEGIFRINGENSQEEYVRDQLNRGVILEGIDVHCLAGLIKAWFRELPTGVLDSLSPEQVMQSQSEEECAQLVRLLPPTEAALLDWAINLMADVAQMEHMNKMNARNIAMVFAPNMTHNSDPLTALMYAVQVMNFLKTLIIRTIRQREDSVLELNPTSRLEPSDENGHHSSSLSLSFKEAAQDVSDENEQDREYVPEEPKLENPQQLSPEDSATETKSQNLLNSIENIPGGTRSVVDDCLCEVVSQVKTIANEHQESSVGSRSGRTQIQHRTCKSRTCQPSNSDMKRGSKKINAQPMVRVTLPCEKGKGVSIIGSINSRTELFEAWR